MGAGHGCIFDAHTHKSVGLIGSSEDMIEIDFADGKVSRVGDQFGVGRVVRIFAGNRPSEPQLQFGDTAA